MKRILNIKHISFAVVLIVLVSITACKKNTLKLTYNYADTTAHVKINFASTYAVGKNTQVKINGQRIGFLTSTLPNRPVPGNAFNIGNTTVSADYYAVQPGDFTLSVSIPKATNLVDTSLAVSNVDSVVLFSAQVTIPDYGYYTVHIADTGAATKSIVLRDDLTQPDSGYFRMRFVNLMPNSTAVDVYYYVNGVRTKVMSNVTYLGSSNYITLPTSSYGPLDFVSAGLPGTSSPLVSMTSLLPNTNQRVYTTYAQGYKLTTTGKGIPSIGVIYDR